MLFLILLIFIATTAAAQDPAMVAPGIVKVEIENDWVRVLRVKEGPHEKAAMHEHPATVVVFLTDVHQRIVGGDGATQEITRKAGDVQYRNRVKHADENISDRPLEAVLIELKPKPPKVKAAAITLDPVKLDPEHHPVVLENEQVRVLRTILEPHLKAPMHEHPHYVVVYLTDLHTAMKLSDGKVLDNLRRPGEVAWRDALKHETENVGDQTAVEIQVELK